MILTTHFLLHEFTDSEIAARQGIDIIPTDEQVRCAQNLCSVILEPVRARLGRPIVITSGIRPKWLNDEVGGSADSAHLYGRAADVKVIGMSPITFHRWLRRQIDIPFDKVILEFNQWVHIQIAKDGRKPRSQFLVSMHRGGDTIYEVAA